MEYRVELALPRVESNIFWKLIQTSENIWIWDLFFFQCGVKCAQNLLMVIFWQWIGIIDLDRWSGSYNESCLNFCNNILKSVKYCNRKLELILWVKICCYQIVKWQSVGEMFIGKGNRFLYILSKWHTHVRQLSRVSFFIYFSKLYILL